ncbi:unnamed protein product [Blepharisma stoltei]|uniref:Kinesin motor domain-containing protein n=1 Tax=Blepharisma stoltei TaxID=1481888 RepID=A0AAU9K4G8_9CILI|nr:unnamed protein product [Blepharisma stoltei]
MARPGRINLLLRLKPSSSSTPDTSFYRISPSLTEFTLITPPNNRTPFYFSNIFPSDSTITPICELVGYPMSDQILDGCNATLIALGAIGSGKTYNLYGEMSRRGLSGGLVQSSIQYLFGKIRSLTAERNITVIVSLFEMYKNKVRDLGIAYNSKGEGIEALLKIYNEQDLAVKDIRGKAYIEDVSLIQVMTAEEIFEIINLGFKMREHAEEISGSIANDATTILSINVTQKDKHGDINSTKSARFNIVDIAGSEHKFTDSGTVENESETELSNLYALKKVLNKVNLVKQGATVNVIPYKISKLTQFLQSGFSGNSTISILTAIDTDPIKYSETGHVLAFVKSITEIDKNIKKNLMQRPDAGALMAHEMAQRLEEEIYELNSMIKKSQLQHEEKLRLFARLVGIDDDLESMVLAKKGTKEFQLAMKYKESFETTKNLNRRNADLEKKNNENKKILDHIKILHQNNKDKQKIELTNLETEIRDLKDLISEYKYKNEEIGQEQTFSNSEGLERMLMHSHLAVEENSATLHNLKLQMQNNTTDLKNLFEMKELGFNEADHVMKKLIYDNEEKQKARFANLEEQFKYLIGDDEDSHREFFESQMEINTYLRNLDETLNEIKKETARMLEIANIQNEIIYDIEDGKYNNGIRPVLIPTKHHPPAPSPILFPM